MRLLIQKGVAPSMEEIAIRVLRFKTDKIVDVFFSSSNTVEEVKLAALKSFEDGAKAADFYLYKSNYLDEAETRITNESNTLAKAKIVSGFTLILKSKSECLKDEYYYIHISYTKTGSFADQKYIGMFDAKDNVSLLQLKKALIEQQFIPVSKDLSPDPLRVREILKNMYFGKILINNTSPLKAQGIYPGFHLLCHELSAPESMSGNELQLYITKRNIENKLYGPQIETLVQFEKFPTFQSIVDHCKEVLKLTNITIAKYIPHKFTWEKIKPPKKQQSDIRKGVGIQEGSKCVI